MWMAPQLTAVWRCWRNAAIMLLLAGFTLPLKAQAVRPDTRLKDLRGHAILVESNAIFLVTSAHCQGAGYSIFRLMVSMDAGHSWKISGPPVEEGSELELVLKKDGKAWIAGDNIAEGPWHDPFILISTDSPTRWKSRTIYRGNAELLHAAVGKQGELLAWIRHVNFDDENWGGPIYIHQSLDGGMTWKVLGRANKVRIEGTGEKFTDLEKLTNPVWRVVNERSDRGFRVQHRNSETSPWHTVSRIHSFPCPDDTGR